MSRQPDLELRCFPREDRQFLADAQRAVAECRETLRRGEHLLAAVERSLRERYPRASVHARDKLAELPDDDGPVWYIYRDGNWAA